MSPVDAIAPAQLRDASPLFAALGDETRLRLLSRLAAGGPLSITRLGSKSPVSRQAITKHLEVLDQAGLVRSSRSGRERIWELETRRLEDAHAYLDRIAKLWDLSLGRLKKFVEDGPPAGSMKG